MPVAVSKAGRTYGFLQVQEKLAEKDGGSGGGGFLYLCLCTGCDKEVKIAGRHLRKGGNTSCGCQRFKRGNRVKDMTGQRFGMLEVLEMVDTGKPTMFWRCRCECGKTCTVDGARLRASEYPKTNCGCESLRGIRTDSVGIVPSQKYNMLTALYQTRVKKTNTPTKDGTAPAWVCLCECGNETIRESHSLRNGTTQSCGCLIEVRKRERVGKDHPSYNPNLTDDERRERRLDPKYRLWVIAVLDRDKVCRRCDSDSRLHCHHIYPYGQHPELRKEITNGVVLCHDCHREFHHKHGNRYNNANQVSKFIGQRVRVKRN